MDKLINLMHFTIPHNNAKIFFHILHATKVEACVQKLANVCEFIMAVEMGVKEV